jgi:predicted site-specific integrase-resolvase
MDFLNICENTLLKLEREGKINIDFRLGNRKRYFQENIIKSLGKMNKN